MKVRVRLFAALRPVQRLARLGAPGCSLLAEPLLSIALRFDGLGAATIRYPSRR